MLKRHIGLVLVTTFGAVLIGGIAAQQNLTQASCINGYYYSDADTQVAGVNGPFGTDVYVG